VQEFDLIVMYNLKSRNILSYTLNVYIKGL